MRIAIDEAGPLSKDDIWDLIQDRLAFPAYFGRNFAALQDCLEDVATPVTFEIALAPEDDPERAQFFQTLCRVISRVAQEQGRVQLEVHEHTQKKEGAAMSETKTESRYIEVEPNVDIHFWDAGAKDAPALLFIPGLTFSGRVFMHQLEHFKDTHRVILVDPRGQGLSTKCPFGNDYQTHGRDLIALTDKLGIEKPTLIGWSCGNLEAWSYMEQAGTDSVSGCVTVDMSPLPHNEDASAWTEGTPQELSETMTKVLNHPDTAAGFWDSYLREIMWQGPLTDEQHDFFIDMSNETPYWITHELFGDAILSDYRAIAQKAAKEIPTLMFIAEHWADIAEPFYHKLCPETPTYVMGGHLMAIQYPEKFNARLEQFLKTGK